MAQMRLDRPWSTEWWGEPFEELRREMDALFRRVGAGVPEPRGGAALFPPVNLYETAGDYVLTAELPGIDPKDIHVSVQGSTLTLEGERKLDYASGEHTALHRQERRSGSFRRAFELPSAVESDKVEAACRHGVLMLRLPKTEDQRPRQIPVTSES